MLKTLSNAELNKLYTDAELCDKDLFAEMRSNVRLVNGEHYQKTNKYFWNRIRDTIYAPTEQKIRITQNHIHSIASTYKNSILSIAQDAIVLPNNESELQDQKASELHAAVWDDFKKKNDWKNRRGQLASDFVDIGEVACKIFFNPDLGEIVGYEPQMGQDGLPMMDQMGQMVPSDVAIKSGQLVLQRIFGFNLLRDPGAKSKEESMWLCNRYMANIEEVKKWIKGDEEKLNYIQQSSDETYKVFNGLSGEYEDAKNQVMIREFYWKPCSEYPKGYYYITTPYGNLFEGELPFGFFPIVWAGFDDVQTSARSRSPIKQWRPFQAEINRSVSFMVETQLSNGFDKIFIQSGAKISPAQHLQGVRAYNVSGIPPTIVEGRAGDQFINYLNLQITSMYRVAKVEEIPLDKATGLDPYTMMFLDARQKKVFSSYATKFGNFLQDVCELSLNLARKYYDQNMIIPIVGKRQIVNIPEFNNSTPLSYQIKIVEGNDDIASNVGKQLSINQLLQYAGASLSKEDIGKLARNMPYLNKEEILDDLVIDYDSAKNIILSLDRGEKPEPNRYDNHKYMIKKITLRMRQSDFPYLSPEIQKNYELYKQLHEQYEIQIQKELQAAEQGFIPAGGLMVTVDVYVDDNGKQRRVRIPQKSVEWLIDKLNKQGAYYEEAKMMNPADLADMGKQLPPPPQGSSVNNMVSGNQNDLQQPVVQGV